MGSKLMYSAVEQGLGMLSTYPVGAAGTLLAGGLFLYYRKVVVRPVLLHSKASTAFTGFLREALPILGEEYRPPIWCFEARMQTVLAGVLRSVLVPNLVEYSRKVLRLRDGGEVALDMLGRPEDSVAEEYSGPIVLLLPGLTGSSQSDYIKSFISVTRQDLGALYVVFNYRGKGGHPLATSRTYCAANTEDLDEVVTHLKTTYPRADILAVGVSLGGIILGRYLCDQGERAREKVLAAMVVSVCFDCFDGSRSIEKPYLNRMLNRHLAGNLVASVKEERHRFEDSCDLELVFSSHTVRDFDSRFTVPQFGYEDVSEYYADATLRGRLHQIRVPLLALNANDDPFQPRSSLPVEEAATTESVAIVTTEYGGHIGFVEGFWLQKLHFSDRLFRQFAHSVFANRDKIKSL